jgi:hypothetical protein
MIFGDLISIVSFVQSDGGEGLLTVVARDPTVSSEALQYRSVTVAALTDGSRSLTPATVPLASPTIMCYTPSN